MSTPPSGVSQGTRSQGRRSARRLLLFGPQLVAVVGVTGQGWRVVVEEAEEAVVEVEEAAVVVVVGVMQVAPSGVECRPLVLWALVQAAPRPALAQARVKHCRHTDTT